jgi:hypothetical protein
MERDAVYTALCYTVTAVGEKGESLFLARLALLLIERVGDINTAMRMIDEAKEGMDKTNPAGANT